METNIEQPDVLRNEDREIFHEEEPNESVKVLYIKRRPEYEEIKAGDTIAFQMIEFKVRSVNLESGYIVLTLLHLRNKPIL